MNEIMHIERYKCTLCTLGSSVARMTFKNCDMPLNCLPVVIIHLEPVKILYLSSETSFMSPITSLIIISSVYRDIKLHKLLNCHGETEYEWLNGDITCTKCRLNFKYQEHHDEHFKCEHGNLNQLTKDDLFEVYCEYNLVF